MIGKEKNKYLWAASLILLTVPYYCNLTWVLIPPSVRLDVQNWFLRRMIGLDPCKKIIVCTEYIFERLL